MAQVLKNPTGTAPLAQPAGPTHPIQIAKHQGATMYHMSGYNGRPLTNTPPMSHAAPVALPPGAAIPQAAMAPPQMMAPPPTAGVGQAAMGEGPANNGPTPIAVSMDNNQFTLANTKEKTPMCLINELARYNKIQHQYTLTDEQGPAHKKIFYVKLLLGEEEYAANGPSIKKAQHAAAASALEKTQYKHPPPKPPKKFMQGGELIGIPGCLAFTDSITPTVELNALVMKRGEPAIYRNIEMPRPQYYPPPNLDFRGMYNQRYHYPRYPRMFYVSLKIGQREFIGEGNTRQAARHNAAQKALKVLSALPLPNQDASKPQMPTDVVPEALSAPEIQEIKSSEEDENDALKSEISLVHEIALKRDLPVNFEVIRESGPPHMRTFVTRCIVGNFVTEGEGNGKKISKKRAAEKMLEELNKLVPLPPSIAKPKRSPGKKKKVPTATLR